MATRAAAARAAATIGSCVQVISYLFTYSVGFFYKVFKSEGYLAFFCHYEEKTSRAECEAACRKDRLSAGQVGRLGVTFKARRSDRAEYKIAYTE